MRLLSLAACIMLVFITQSLEAATYFVSAAGNDTNAGTTKRQAWASIDKVNGTVFSAGDSVLFEGGSTFVGSIYFESNVRGTATSPVYFGSYGTGKAIISSGNETGFYVYNSAGFKIRNLVFRGAGRTINSSSGVEFYMDLASNTRLNYINIDSVEVFGYKLTGILVGSWNGASGFDNVSITNSSAHDNGDGGIGSYAEATLGHRNMYVGNSKVYNNSGLPEKTDSHSGNGIVLGGVDGAVIEYCEAYNNGWLNAWAAGGPIGIWGYRCNNLVIQYNESHHNKTGTTKDGGGFDIDGGCTNSTMQYNYSHDNEGAGYLVAQYSNAPVMKGVIIRYNISENDARKNSYGAIHLWSSGANGGIQGLEVYNNTVYVTPSSNGQPKAMQIQKGGTTQALIRNNIFQATGGLELVNAQVTAGVRFEGNNYWATGTGSKYKWGSTTHTSIDAWRTATGQEKLNGVALGYDVDPQLKQPGQGTLISDPRLLYTLKGYEQKDTSPLIGKGIDLTATFGTNTGTRDFYGNSVVQRAGYTIGAHHQTESREVCLYAGTMLLDYATTAGGTYSGPGVTEGKYFNPLIAGTGNKALTYSFTDRSGQQQLLHYTVTVLGASTTCYQKPVTVVAPPSCTASGTILREQWNSVSGSNVSDIPLSKAPSSTSQLNLFESPSGLGSNYGARIRGYICPPASGEYTFFIAGDDKAELWLSTDDSPSNKRRIANVEGWTSARQWDKYSSQKSVSVRLEAGKRYYIEALHKQGWGGDNLAVAWQQPDGRTEAPIAGSRLSPFEGSTDSAPAPTEPTPTEPEPTEPGTCTASGTILREQWNSVSGSNVSDIPLSKAASSTSQLNLFESPSGLGSNYGARIRGYICPPASGKYTFFIAGDDKAELWLSTDDSPSNKRRIANVEGWTSARQWNKYPSQKSVSIRLEAGKRYYIEALHKQGWGSDNLAVAWQQPDGRTEAPIAGSRLSPYDTTQGANLSSSSSSAQGVATVEVEKAELTAYPNPFTTNATIAFTLATFEEVSLQLFDLQGRMIRQLYKGTADAKATRSFELTSEGLTHGVYVLRLVTGSKVLTQKIVLDK